MRPSRILAGAKKLPYITSKRGNKNFYKGRGAPTMGTHGHKENVFYISDDKFAKFTFKAPDLTGFPLKAYVARSTPRVARSLKEDELDI
mmetsp:Transcript_24282/g.34275  ORF Transcript_24282/g.34275 Transcript_24282/m.34275 type:complete len:89 (-) Transcript_24282:53-319(-)